MTQKINLHIPDDLATKLEEKSTEEYRTKQSYIRKIIADALKQK